MKWILDFLSPKITTAADDIAAVLGAFTSMIVTLDAAIEKAAWEVSASYHRTDEAYEAWRVTADAEYALREQTWGAIDKARQARTNIAALTGETL